MNRQGRELPLLARRGGCGIRKIAKHPLRRRRGGGSINFRRTWTTTLDASPYRRSISYRCSAPLLAERGNFVALAIHSHLQGRTYNCDRRVQRGFFRTLLVVNAYWVFAFRIFGS